MFSKYEGHEGNKSGRASSPENMTPAAGGNEPAAPMDNDTNPQNNATMPNNTNNNTYNNPTGQAK